MRPLQRLPDTYNGHPPGYVSLAAQKNYYALYMMGPAILPAEMKRIEDGFKRAGKKLSMGKSCIRFRKIEDLPMDVKLDSVGRLSPDAHVEAHERARPQGTHQTT